MILSNTKQLWISRAYVFFVGISITKTVIVREMVNDKK